MYQETALCAVIFYYTEIRDSTDDDGMRVSYDDDGNKPKEKKLY
jgi:hypothetical protein